MTLIVRPATAQDAARCAEIYAPYVADTPVSFETTPPDVAEIARRIGAAHAWLVATAGDDVVGYAYGGPHATRDAYRYACDVSVYVDPHRQGQGIGSMLYQRLFENLATGGFHAVFAGITQPNPASMALHQRCGFTPVGTYREVGWKFGRWHDVTWVQRLLPGV